MHWILYDLLELVPSNTVMYYLISSLAALGSVFLIALILMFLFSIFFNPKQHQLYNRTVQIRFWWANIMILIVFFISVEIIIGLWLEEWFPEISMLMPLWVALLTALIISGIIISPFRSARKNALETLGNINKIKNM